MKTGGRALREGWRRLRRYWPALLAAYVVNLASAVALAAFPAAGLFEAARRTALEQAARGISASMVIDFLGSGLTNITAGIGSDGRPLQLGVWWLFITAAVLPFVAGLPAAFLNGGLVLTYVEAPAPWRFRRFVWGCWRWFGAFLLLGLGQVVVTAVVGVPTALLMVVMLGRAPWAPWVLAALVAPVLAALLALFELAGVWMVSRSTRNFSRALWETLRYMVRQAAPLAVLYALALAGLGLAHGLYTWGLWPHLPLAVWPVVLVVQQAFILTRLAARLLRLSACAALVPAPAGQGA